MILEEIGSRQGDVDLWDNGRALDDYGYRHAMIDAQCQSFLERTRNHRLIDQWDLDCRSRCDHAEHRFNRQRFVAPVSNLELIDQPDVADIF